MPRVEDALPKGGDYKEPVVHRDGASWINHPCLGRRWWKGWCARRGARGHNDSGRMIQVGTSCSDTMLRINLYSLDQKEYRGLCYIALGNIKQRKLKQYGIKDKGKQEQ